MPSLDNTNGVQPEMLNGSRACAIIETMSKIEALQHSLAAIEAQRAILGDAAVDAVLPLLREQIAALKAQKTYTRQRKMITVLFADVSGFTAIADKLDAEDVMSLINQVWQRLDQVIVEHGGVIDKHIGDAVMALWGVEEAREDDPERAVRAALAMQSTLEEFRDHQAWPEELHVEELHMHTGIHTGPVLLGMVGSKNEYTAIGDTVNIAARIEQAAPMCNILVSHETYRQVRGLFDVAEQPPLEVKGKSEPISIYRIQSALPQVFRPHTRGIEGVETRMIGREDELLFLQNSLQQVRQNRCAQTVVIVGDAGLGKSRLLYEFEKWVELQPSKVQTLRGRANQQMQGTPFGLFRSLFAERMDILDNDPLAVARKKLLNGLHQITQNESQEQASFIGQMIGLDFSAEPQVKELLSEPARMRERIFHHTTRFFTQASSQAPVAIYLDDIHWADQSSLDLLEHLSGACQTAPLLILCLARPALYENHPEWAQNLDCMNRLDLKPLSQQESHALADEILRRLPAIPPDLRQMVTGNAEGNPFYMEELIKMLIDDGVILTGARGWRIQPGKLIQARVPATLTGVLQARLDSLPAEEKSILQRASVVGRIFWDALITHIGHNTDTSSAPTSQALLGLTRRELVYARSTSSFAGAKEYIFKHNILQDITYETVLKEIRKVYHGLVAAWLVAQSGERAEEYAALIAEHYEKAGRPVQAASYLYHAAGQAYALTAFNDAIATLEHALAILPAPNQAVPPSDQITALRFKIHARLGEIHSMGKSAHEQAKPHLETALKLARTREDESGQAAVLGQLGRIAYWQGEYEKGQTYLQEALPLARKLQDHTSTMLILRQLGNIATERGLFDQAQEWLNESLSLARALADSESAALALNTLGNNAFNQSNFSAALAYYEEALQIFRTLSKRIAIGVALGNIGLVHYQAGDYAACKNYQTQALEVARAIGNKSQVAFALSVLGAAAVRLDEYAIGRAHLDEALDIFWNIGETPFLLGTLPDYARFFWRTGSPERALELLGLVRAHPAALSESRQTAERVLAELPPLPGLTQERIQAALARGEKLNLEETIKSLLNNE